MTSRARAALAVLSVLAAGLAAWFWLGRSAPPQLPASEEVFKSVDALFTAITASDDRQLAACQARLTALKDSHELPPAAAARLEQIIAQAKTGKWEDAARALYDFMEGQKRTGAPIEWQQKQLPLRARR
jgi:hypothetical protein